MKTSLNSSHLQKADRNDTCALAIDQRHSPSSFHLPNQTTILRAFLLILNYAFLLEVCEMITIAFIIFGALFLFVLNGLSIAFCNKREMPEDHQHHFIRLINVLVTIMLISSYFELLLRLGKPL